MLEEAGLVRTEKNRGVFVRDLPVEEAIEIFDLRAAMDELVGRRLAAGIAPAALKEIRGLVDQMEQAVKVKDADAYHLLNLRFHDRLVELAGNRKLTDVYRKLIKELSLFRRLNLTDALADAGLGRRSTGRSSRRSPPATPRPPGAPCTSTSWKARNGRSGTTSARLTPATARRAAGKTPR